MTKPNVKLIGEEGNAFNIIGKVIREMKKSKIEEDIIDKYVDEATSGDYHNLLRVTMKYVNVV